LSTKINKKIAILKARPVFSVTTRTNEAPNVEFDAEISNIYMLCIKQCSLVNNKKHDGGVKLGRKN
jgi:hypothetical protein